MSRTAITRFDVKAKTSEKKTDWVAQEKPFYVFLGNTHCFTIFCSPSNLKELAVGHLVTEGLVKSLGEIKKLNLDSEKMTCRVDLNQSIDVEARIKLQSPFSRIIYSACGSGSLVQFSGKTKKVTSSLRIKSQTIHECVKNLNLKAETFRKTGGTHAAGLCASNGDLLGFAEDVGRHNAVDKVIGMAVLASRELGECFLTTTGRLSGDVVLKAARTGIPIVASLSAPLDSGVDVAKSSHVTLIGFVRGWRMNIYAFPERILA
jgi:FdhD protein